MRLEISSRHDAIQKIIDEKKLNGIMFFNNHGLENPNFIYSTDCNELGLFVLTKEPILYTIGWKNKFNSHVKNTHLHGLKDIPKTKGKIGIDIRHTHAGILQSLKKITGSKFVDISNEMENLRSVKSVYEIKKIREACKIAEKAWKIFKKHMAANDTEIATKYKIELEMARLGVYPSFPTIVASGENISEPHHIANNTLMKKNTLVDFGIRNKFYCTDNTRTFGSKYEKLLTDIIKDVEELIKPGASCNEIDKFVRKRMGSLEKTFITALGHGIGIAVHELPVIASGSNDILKENMIITIEPGIYTKKDGIRIENMYLVKENGCENLTKFDF